jgi:hypothetical protein
MPNSTPALDSALDRPRKLGGRGNRTVSSGGRFGVGEGTVRSPEPQRVRQRLLPLTDLRAGVDVEQPHRLEQRPGSDPERALYGGGRYFVVDDQGHILLGHREAGDHRDIAAGRRRGDQGIKIDFRSGRTAR